MEHYLDLHIAADVLHPVHRLRMEDCQWVKKTRGLTILRSMQEAPSMRSKRL
jgi:hypothetical protein